jgi:hypothetical protein
MSGRICRNASGIEAGGAETPLRSCRARGWAVVCWLVGERRCWADRAENGRYVKIADMEKDDVKAVLGRVLTWPADDQEKVARFVREVEQRRADDDISEQEWEIIEARAARRDLATDKEVEQVFSRYRGA